MGRLLIIGVSGSAGGLLFIWLFAIRFPVRFPDWLGLFLFALSCVVTGGIAWRLCGEQVNM